MDRSDLELLTAWRAGDTKAGEALFVRHFDSVERFFRNKIDHGIQDLVQDVFLACINSRSAFRAEASFKTYLLGIARNKLCDYFRTRYREPVDFTTQSVVDLGTSPSQVVANKQEHKLLLRALRSIPLESQTVLELYYWESLRGPELAQVLGINANTVRSRLHRAREKLKLAIKKLGAAPGLVEETISNLDDWATALRERVPAAADRSA